MKNNSFFSSAFSTARLFFAVNVLAGIGFNIGVVGVGWFIIASTGSNQLLGLYGALSLISAFITLAAAGAVGIAILVYTVQALIAGKPTKGDRAA